MSGAAGPTGSDDERPGEERPDEPVDGERPGDDELPPDPFPGDPFAGAAAGSGPTPSPSGPIADLLRSLGVDPEHLGGAAGLGGLGGLLGALGGLGGAGAGAGAGGLAWDTARQLAVWTAAGGAVEPNVDPLLRIRLGETAKGLRAVVADTTGLDLSDVEVQAVTRAGWAASFLEDHRALFDRVVRASAQPGSGAATGESTSSPLDALAPLLRSLAPMTMSSTIGTIAGQLGLTALGTYEVLLPRTTNRLTLVPTGIDAFASQWSLAPEQAATQIIAADLVAHAVLSVAHVASALSALVDRYASLSSRSVEGLEERFTEMTAALESGGDLDPSSLLAAPEPTREQLAVRDEIETLLVPVVGFIDYATTIVGARVLGDNRKVVEAWRRRRSADTEVSRELARIIGLPNVAALSDRGLTFIGGVLQRGGRDGLLALFTDASRLPTANELDAPGLWLARIGMDS